MAGEAGRTSMERRAQSTPSPLVLEEQRILTHMLQTWDLKSACVSQAHMHFFKSISYHSEWQQKNCYHPHWKDKGKQKKCPDPAKT